MKGNPPLPEPPSHQWREADDFCLIFGVTFGGCTCTSRHDESNLENVTALVGHFRQNPQKDIECYWSHVFVFFGAEFDLRALSAFRGPHPSQRFACFALQVVLLLTGSIQTAPTSEAGLVCKPRCGLLDVEV